MGTARDNGRRGGEGGYVSGNGDGRLQVQVYVERVGERTEAWRQLMRHLLSPPPCKGERLPLDFRQKDEGEGHA